MKPINRAIGTIALSLMLFAIQSGAQAQFSGPYDPANWSIVNVSGGNGSVNTTNAPTSIVLTGPDNLSGQAYTRYQIEIPASGTLSFSWSVVHNDPTYDGFGYWINNTYTELTDITASGNTSISVTAGQLFAFYGETFDGCCGTFNATITNFSAPLPTANDAGVLSINNPSDNMCADSVDVEVDIKNFGINQIAPVTVNWSVNGTTQSSVQYTGVLDTVGGSGNDTATVILGTYFFEGSTELKVWTSQPNNVADTSNINDTMTLVFEAPNPTLDLQDQDMCEGAFFVLSVPGTWATFSWNTGATSQQIMISQGGVYAVTVTDATGCQASDSVFVTEYPAPVIDLGGTLSGCDEMELDAGNAGASFLWNTGETTQSITVNASGFYSVSVTSAQGCESSDEVQASVFPSPNIDLGANFALCVDLDEAAVLAVSSQYTFYQWNTGATTSQIIVGGMSAPVGQTPFSVTVTDANGCSASDTIVVNFKKCIPAGIASTDLYPSFKVYPVPSQGYLSVEFKLQQSAELELDVLDFSGRVVHRHNENLAAGTSSSTLNLSHLAKGTYIMRASLGGETKGSTLFVLE